MATNPELRVLKKERLKAGLTVRKMAEAIGVSKSMYAFLEKGEKRLTYSHAVKIADTLGKRPDELFIDDYKAFYKKTLI